MIVLVQMPVCWQEAEIRKNEDQGCGWAHAISVEVRHKDPEITYSENVFSRIQP
jgi:hypothetical protein